MPGPTFSSAGRRSGVEPVAITTRAALISVWSSTARVCGPVKRAWPRSLSASSKESTLSTTKPTKRSRSRRTLSITAGPSMRTSPACTPKGAECCIACALSAAAIRSLLGMQPTRAQVVPYTPPSITTVRAPWALAAR